MEAEEAGSASLRSLRIKLLPLDEQVAGDFAGFAYTETRPVIAAIRAQSPANFDIQGIFVGYLRRTRANHHPMLVGICYVDPKSKETCSGL